MTAEEGGAMTLDLDQLLGLAGKATPGPWVEQTDLHGVYDVDGTRQVVEWADVEADTEYIAAASPDVVIELIEKLKDCVDRGPATWTGYEELEEKLGKAEREIDGDEHRKGLRRELAFAQEVGATWKTEAKRFEARLRAAEEVVEVARRLTMKPETWRAFGDALRHYDEAVKE